MYSAYTVQVGEKTFKLTKDMVEVKQYTKTVYGTSFVVLLLSLWQIILLCSCNQIKTNDCVVQQLRSLCLESLNPRLVLVASCTPYLSTTSAYARVMSSVR